MSFGPGFSYTLKVWRELTTFGELCKYRFDSSGKARAPLVPTPTLETNKRVSFILDSFLHTAQVNKKYGNVRLLKREGSKIKICIGGNSLVVFHHTDLVLNFILYFGIAAYLVCL